MKGREEGQPAEHAQQAACRGAGKALRFPRFFYAYFLLISKFWEKALSPAYFRLF